MFVKVIQLKLSYVKSTMLRKELLLIALFFGLFNLNAQVKNNIKLRVEAGFLLFSESENFGLFLKVEPKLKVLQNVYMGVRFGLTLNPQKFEIDNSSQFYINEEDDHGVISFVPTFDYYLNQNNFRPYLGLGIGIYVLSDIDAFPIAANPSDDEFIIRVNNQIGILFRGGFELGKLRFGLEYNYIPKADIEIPNVQVIGTIDTRYFGLSIGYTIEGGKS